MSSITSATSAQQYSPLPRLQNELTSEVSAGTISSTDQSALSSALDDIDKAMQASKPTSGSTPPSSDDMKSKIDDLIAGEVSSGKLTSAQADELKNVFAQAFKGGPGGAGGAGGGGGAGGAAGAGATSTSDTSTDPADTNKDGTVSAAERAAYEAKSTSASQTDGSDTGSTGSTDSDATKLLKDFLSLLKNSQSGSSTYGAGGDSLSKQVQSLIVNYQA